METEHIIPQDATTANSTAASNPTPNYETTNVPQANSPNNSKKILKQNIYAMIFMIVMSAIFLTLGAYAQGKDVNSGLLITEFGIVLGGSLIFALIKRENLKDFFRLKPAKFSVFVKMFFMSFFMIPIASLLNIIAITFIDYFGTLRTPDIPIGDSPMGLLGSVFVVAVSAGICEEMMFRGAILSTFEKALGKKKAAIMAAVLFGMFHFNLGNLLSPIALGLVFAYVTHVTGSIFPAMFGHFMNNGISVVASYLVSKAEAPAIQGGAEIEPLLGELTTSQMIVQIVILLIIASICILVVRAFLKSIKKSYPKKPSELSNEPVEERYDYPSTDYKIWEKKDTKLGTIAGSMLGAFVIFYAAFNYLIFFVDLKKLFG